jgi:tRNA nucleotidyltransferase (CCA-adding enzyme)
VRGALVALGALAPLLLLLLGAGAGAAGGAVSWRRGVLGSWRPQMGHPTLLLLLPQSAAGLLERWRLPSDPLFHPAPPLDGLSLQQELAIPPGRLLGRLLAHLTLERAFGRLVAGPEAHAEARAEVLAAAQSWWQEHGQKGGADRRHD